MFISLVCSKDDAGGWVVACLCSDTKCEERSVPGGVVSYNCMYLPPHTIGTDK